MEHFQSSTHGPAHVLGRTLACCTPRQNVGRPVSPMPTDAPPITAAPTDSLAVQLAIARANGFSRKQQRTADQIRVSVASAAAKNMQRAAEKAETQVRDHADTSESGGLFPALVEYLTENIWNALLGINSKNAAAATTGVLELHFADLQGLLDVSGGPLLEDEDDKDLPPELLPSIEAKAQRVSLMETTSV
ncbi:hypothetical protein VP01_3246g1 [Puccinia sorghi]|uniref:Uncharacterized protein n=1 Tax=Puccinia sorghi TaxID=27349 RepID=A0A0L6UY50_9BASI|nr:hypothetical protein VP01_3246g1 [Puccinia sorghi]